MTQNNIDIFSTIIKKYINLFKKVNFSSNSTNLCRKLEIFYTCNDKLKKKK